LSESLGLQLDLHLEDLSKLDEEIELGEVKFFIHNWLYDFPHPQNFLTAFYSPTSEIVEGKSSYPNITRYDNSDFNRFYEAGKTASTKDGAYENFHKAEQVLMKDAAIIVLWYDEGYWSLQPNVRNMHINPLQYRDFTKVYKVKKEKGNNL